MESRKEELADVSGAKVAIKKFFTNPLVSLIIISLLIILVFYIFARPIKNFMQSFGPSRPVETEKNEMKGGEKK